MHLCARRQRTSFWKNLRYVRENNTAIEDVMYLSHESSQSYIRVCVCVCVGGGVLLELMGVNVCSWDPATLSVYQS